MSISVAAQLIHEIEKELNELRKEYNVFFSGVTNIEPYDQRERLALKIKRLRNLNHSRTEDQFRANNLVSKVNSMFQLWDRQIEKKYTGEMHKRRKKRPTAPPPPPKKKEIVISDPSTQREQVVALYDEYTRLNTERGQKVINFNKFQSFIKNQTKKVQTQKNVNDVRYEVTLKDDKVVIKTKTSRN